MANAEAKFALWLLPGHFDRAHPRGWRTSPTPSDHYLDDRPLPLKHCFNSTIQGVPHPTGDLSDRRLINGVGAEGNDLDPSSDPDMRPD